MCITVHVHLCQMHIFAVSDPDFDKNLGWGTFLKSNAFPIIYVDKKEAGGGVQVFLYTLCIYI